MRIGKYCNDLKTTQWDLVRPLWCKPFGLDSGSSFRALHVVNNCTTTTSSQDAESCPSDDLTIYSSSSESNVLTLAATSVDDNVESSNKRGGGGGGYLNPDWVYYIGIEIKPGKGLLKDTTFVYFSTRYYLVNKTNKDLLVAQYPFVRAAREKRMGLSWRSSSHNFGLNQTSTAGNNSYHGGGSGETRRREQANNIVLLKDSMRQFHWPRYQQTFE